jgi:uncharacterized C2H2 Zn-finger protein
MPESWVYLMTKQLMDNDFDENKFAVAVAKSYFVECRICQAMFENDVLFHRHVNHQHLLTIERYYHKYLPRYDKLTGDLIEFKNKEYYFSHDFNSKQNMREWIFSRPPEEVRQYLKDLIIRRRGHKQLVYAPTQVELRSIMSPSIITFQKFFPDYYEFCEEMGLISKFSYTIQKKTPPCIHTVMVDTREKLPYRFEQKRRQKLDYGDYALAHPRLIEWPLFIERKTTTDFVHTFSSGFERFEKEVERANEAKAYLLVLVEDTMEDVLDFKRKCDVSPKLRITPEFVFHNVRKILQKYKGLQFLFVAGRAEAEATAAKILFAEDLHLKYDLQLLKDLKKL